MNVFAHAGEFRVGKPVLPWFYAMAANELRTCRRRGIAQRRRAAEATLADALPGPDDPERDLVERELSESLAQAVASLDEDGARAIAAMLHDAERPSVTRAAFRKRVSRAYARLRWLLGALDGH
jgi:DNA-directed RNA polymerase specialized sigma24 family protein